MHIKSLGVRANSTRGFQQRPSTYRLSKAPTSRGRCRKCRKAISKGAARVEICAFVRPGRSTVLLRCTACIDTAFATAVLATHATSERVPADATLCPVEAAQIRDSITRLASPAKREAQGARLR